MKDPTSKKPLDFLTFEFYGRYTPQIPSKYTPDPHQDSSLNEELRGVTLEEPLYHIPNTEVDQLHHHTRVYLMSIGQIPIICQIPRYHFSQRRTQSYSEDETLTSSIDDLIIDTILKIRQPIATIVHSEIQEDPEFHNFLDFLEGDSTFYDFPETQAGCFRPPKPLETNPPSTTIPSPRPNFNFRANMASDQPQLVVDAIAVLGAQHPLPKLLEKLLPKFDSGNDVSQEDHIKQLILSLRLMYVENEDVVCICRLFLYTFVGKASIWFFSLIARLITSWQQFETTFMTQFGDDKTSEILFLEISQIKINKNENVKDFNQRFITLLNQIPDKSVESIQIEFYISSLPPLVGMFIKGK